MTIDKAYQKDRDDEKQYGHNKSAPETKLAIQELQINQLNYLKQMEEFKEINDKRHAEIKELIKELGLKVDCAMREKADRTVVDGLGNDVKDLISWKWKLIGIGIAGFFILNYLKDYIVK